MSALAVVLAVVGALPIPALTAWWLTPLLTGWRRQPDVIQGCNASVHCAEMNTFMTTWAISILVYAALCAWGHRRAVKRETAKWQRTQERAWPWQADI